MRLPQQFLESPFFLFHSVEELLQALSLPPDSAESEQIRALSERGLPPITSMQSLATMFGVNAGLIWSFANRPKRHYRTFNIPKGKKGVRRITAPRVALKIVQKWLGYQLSHASSYPNHVYGFVPGRSHIQAAILHAGADWALSVDIERFFETTPASLVQATFARLGYGEASASLLTSLTCFDGCLAQGAPSSPSLSNLCFYEVDAEIASLAKRHQCRISRYADDIVLSGSGACPTELLPELRAIFEHTPWRLAEAKRSLQPLKGRIKIHGLVVSGSNVRLTKGYRNKLRAYQHVLSSPRGAVTNAANLRGHIQYAKHANAIIEKSAKK